MRKIGFTTALVVTGLVTAALTGVLYAGNRIAGFPFAPVDLLDWLIGSGSALVVGLSSGLEQAAAAATNLPTADRLISSGLALLLFLIPALFIGLVFRWVVNRRRFLPDTLDGVIAGVLFGAPLALVSITLGRSAYHPVLQAVWYGLWFSLWGVALSYAYRRLATVRVPTPADDGTPVDPELVARPDRRNFLLQLGASAAALTAITTAAGTSLSTTGERMRLPRTFPTAGPEFQRAQRELYQTFRRFAIINFERTNVNAYQVLALGSQYPDYQYVSVWLGEGSPIVIYQNLETALDAFRLPTGITDIIWLDDAA